MRVCFGFRPPALQRSTHLRTCLQNVSCYTTLIPKASDSPLWKKFKTTPSGTMWHEPDYVPLWLHVTESQRTVICNVMKDYVFLCTFITCYSYTRVHSHTHIYKVYITVTVARKSGIYLIGDSTLLRTHANYLIHRVNLWSPTHTNAGCKCN